MSDTMLSVDWLCINFLGSPIDSQRFKFKKLDYQCRQFRELYTVYDGYREYGTLAAVPTLSALRCDLMQLKFDNKLLYTMNIGELVDEFIVFQGWEFYSISRLDICLDFNQFKTGLSPRSLIDRFMSGKLYPVSKCDYTVSGRFANGCNHEYLRIGSRKSDIVARLYNKTAEMNSVRFKHYISDSWKATGVDTSRDVWRLEFQLSGKSKEFLDVLTGVVYRVNKDLLYDYKSMKSLFALLCYKYFRFKIPSGDSNKSRWKDFELFDFETVKARKLVKTTAIDSTRSLRIFSARLARFCMELNVSTPARHRVVKECCVDWLIDNKMLSYVGRRGIQVRL